MPSISMRTLAVRLILRRLRLLHITRTDTDMAGPYTGTWRQSVTSQAQYTGALRWGTGNNAVHSIEGAGPALRLEGAKLNIDPLSTPGGQDTDVLTPDYSWDYTFNPD